MNLWKLSFTGRDGLNYRLIRDDDNPDMWTQVPPPGLNQEFDPSYAPHRVWLREELLTNFFIRMQEC